MHTIEPGRPLAATRGPRLPAGWPLLVGFLGYGLWWALGAAPFVWIGIAVPLVVHLAVRPEPVRVPPGAGAWFAFLGWMVLSATQVDTGGRLVGFTYRFAQYVAATAVFLAVYNLPRRELSDRRVSNLLVASWSTVVVGGFLALAVPTGQLPSLTARLLPAALADHDFVRQLITPTFAQVQMFLGFPLPRPAAPFDFTNTWGAAFALLLPWVLAAAVTGRRGRWLPVALAASVVPALVSVNRAMFLSIGAALVVLVVAGRDPRLRRYARRILVGVVVIAALVSLSPLGSLVQERLDTPHSNNARTDIALETTERALDSPWLGYGAPRPYEGEGIRPPAGTQGQLWLVLFSHGLPGLAFFGWFLVRLWVLAGRSPQGIWLRMTLAAAAVQLPFYNLVGAPLVFIMLAAGFTLRSLPVGRTAPGAAVPDSLATAA